MPPLKVLVLNAYAAENAHKLSEFLTTPWTVDVHVERDPPERLRALMNEADALIVPRFATALPPAPRLRLIQSPVAGYDRIEQDALPPGCTVCNVHEHETGIAEHVMSAMLEWTIGLMKIDARFRTGSWEDGVSALGPTHGELSGKTLGIVGYGHIGREVAKRARAFGMRVIAVTRTPRRDDYVDDVAGMDGLDAMLSKCDFVLVACPLSPETRGLLDKRRLALCKQSAVVINMARGEIIDEDAFYEALRDGVIGGAVIDVWYHGPTPEEPNARPSRHPFHELPNIIMTPHSASWSDGLIDRRWRFISANLDRFARGEPLQNVVMRG
jgi:phosphoglycerate dehydrogenase-like enzyme